jgi:hypothetical protein
MAQEDKGLVSRIGPIEIDWPRSMGFFGALGLATAVGLIEPPLGLFIAAVPFLKMLNRPQLPTPTRFASQVLDGMAKPVGGDAEGTIRFAGQGSSSTPRNDRAAGGRPTETGRARRDRTASHEDATSRRRTTSSGQRSAR